MGEKTLADLLFKLWDKLPPYAQVAFAVLLLIILAAIAVKYTIPAIKAIRSVKTRRKFTTTDIRDHSLITQLNYILGYKVSMMRFGDPKRDRIFQTIIKTRVATINNYIQEILVDLDSNMKISKSEFKQKAMTAFTSMYHRFDEVLKEELSLPVYDLVIASSRGYNQWEERNLVFLKEMFEHICTSAMYDDNLERMWAIFSLIQASLDATILVVERTFKEFNGELDAIL